MTGPTGGTQGWAGFSDLIQQHSRSPDLANKAIGNVNTVIEKGQPGTVCLAFGADGYLTDVTMGQNVGAAGSRY